jgi:hypothetical protein
VRSVDDEHRRFHVRDVLAFVEPHGEWWFPLRAKKQTEALRDVVRRLDKLEAKAHDA